LGNKILKFLQPKYLGIWIGMGFLRGLAVMPFSLGLRLSGMIGGLVGTLNRKRKYIVQKNIAICFPQLTPLQQQHRAQEHLRYVGLTIFETAMFHFWSEKRIAERMHIEGLDELLAAMKQQQGIILLSGHMVPMEICILGLALKLRSLQVEKQIHPVYQVNENPLLEKLITNIRQKRVGPCIDRNKIKEMIRLLKAGEVVWYAPDQAFHAKGAMEVDFFGQAAWSNTATSRLAKVGNAKVFPFLMAHDAKLGYRLKILPALEHFPSESPAADTRRFHQILEQWIEAYPAQYLWLHRRFKAPAGGQDPY
jgi:KDO2-lipid IV(A) lauroyltransferase